MCTWLATLHQQLEDKANYLAKLVCSFHGFSKNSNESSYTPNLSERTKHAGGDVGVSPDALIDDDSTHTQPDTAAFSNTSLHLLLCAMASGEQNTRLAV